MTKHIERQIENLKERILRLGTLVEEAISKSITAFINRDAPLAQRVMASDEDIDSMEVEVEEELVFHRQRPLEPLPTQPQLEEEKVEELQQSPVENQSYIAIQPCLLKHCVKNDFHR